jgi:hypothetical protein
MEQQLFEKELTSVIDEVLGPLQLEQWIAENLPRMTPNEEMRLKFSVRSERDLEVLQIISRYSGGVPGILIQEYLDSRPQPNLRNILSLEKDMPLDRLGLYVSRNLSERDFFGNFLKRVKEILKTLRTTLWKPARARRIIRHRGYRDKGSLRPSHRWMETRDFSFTEKQNQIEEDRLYQEMVHFFYCGLG